MAAKSFVDFIQWYRLEYDCDPDFLAVWNAATLFMEEKLKAHNISVMPCAYCGPDIRYPEIIQFCPYCGRNLRTA
jgi:hypothetical protein